MKDKETRCDCTICAKAEYQAMTRGVFELLYCDKKCAISIDQSPVQYDWMNHIEIDIHFIKEKLKSGLICTNYISTYGQLANILTKRLSSSMFQSIYPSWEW